MYAVSLKVCVEMHFIIFDICKHIHCMIIDCISLRHNKLCSVLFCFVLSLKRGWLKSNKNAKGCTIDIFTRSK